MGGMRGRILTQAVLLLAEGLCILIFANMTSVWASIVMLTIFSIFVQGAEGSTYGIVPYVNSKSPGAVAGIVGAGGPTGAVSFGLVFRSLPDDAEKAFRIMGGVVLASGVISALINIKGHRGLLFGTDTDFATKLKIPAPEVDDDSTHRLQAPDGEAKELVDKGNGDKTDEEA